MHITIIIGKALSLIFFIYFTVNMAEVSAQTFPNVLVQSFTHDSTINGVFKTIALYPNGALTYHEFYAHSPNSTQLFGHFTYNRNASDVYQFDLPYRYYITDIAQADVDNIVAFCGYRIEPTNVSYIEVPFVGWFSTTNIPNTGSVDLKLVEFPDTMRLSRVESFFHNNTNSLVAIGIVRRNGAWHSVVMDIHNIFQSPNWNYTMSVLDRNASISDMTKTGKYMAFCGTVGSHGFCLFKEAYYLMTTPYSLQNPICFQSDDEQNMAGLQITYMGNREKRTGDSVVVCHTSIASDLESHNRYSVHDLSTSLMDMLSRQEIVMNCKGGTGDLRYLSDLGLIFSVQGVNPADCSLPSPIAALKPFPTSNYTMSCYYPREWPFINIDVLNQSPLSARHLLMGGRKAGKTIWTLKEMSSPLSACNSVIDIEINKLNVIPGIECHIEVDSELKNTNVQTIHLPVQHSTPYTVCH